LRTWVRVATARLQVDLERKRSDKDGRLDTAAEGRLVAASDDPELEFMKQHYRAAFRAAFADALDEMEPQMRNVLRLSVCARLSATKIAELYKVHRATAKRWLAAARRELSDGTRAALARRLDVDPDEFGSIVGLIQTHFDVSVARLLQ
jgi:RNA polymerase sigma-70 factor (ECF subfamily)